MFWFARNRLEFEESIVSFDLALEEFKVIPAPALFRGEAKLAVYEERLALLHSSFAPNSSNYVIDLWVIEEGIGASWSKKFTFGPYPYSLQPLTICRNHIVGVVSYIGMYHMEEEWEKRGKTNYIFIINISSNEFKVTNDRKRGYTGRSFEYVESLLSPSNILLGNP
ncbi:unnamed protein product [Cuscuta epithymum]|uniref:F-box associated beta-propeller type 3 domain-containing protein n=1 Tax=Cuscuta epithymum TaxID=186058 RepID=A0AAV0G450_9ASTE|nr:unnamed protein product [Cuscuta epithymum]